MLTRSARITALCSLALPLAGCAALMSYLSPRSGAGQRIDFAEALEFARRADAAYLDEEEIRARYPGRRIVVEDLPASEVRYVIVFDDAARTQDVAVRGTANLANIEIDAAYTPQPDPLLNVHLHSGFALSAVELRDSVSRHLKDGYATTLSGHSLGGALAVILGMYLEKEGQHLVAIRTFGQPKVTNLEGARAMAGLPLIRFVNRGDPVAEVPPAMPLGNASWYYAHLGPAVLLWTGSRYIYIEEDQKPSAAVLAYWSRLGSHDVAEHRMEAYLAALERHQGESVQISYEERESYP